MYAPKHASNHSNRGRFAMFAGLAVVLSFLAAFFAGTMADANAATVHHVNWTATTANALQAVQDRPSVRNITTLAADAAHLTGRGYFRSDTLNVLADAYSLLSDQASTSAKAGKYIAKDRSRLDTALQYALQDVSGGA